MEKATAVRMDDPSRAQDQPASFAARGVTLPMTSPQLAGARIRLLGAGGLELLMAHPGGSPGVYIVPWATLPQACVPTLHDRRFWAQLQGRPAISPATIAQVSRRVAIEGHAGRAAAAAARATDERFSREAVRINFALVLRLIEQTESAVEAGQPASRDEPARLEHRARRAMSRAGTLLARSAEDVAGGLEDIASLVAEDGLPRAGASRKRRLLDELATMVGEIGASPGPETAPEVAAEVVAEAVRLTTLATEPVLAAIDAAFGDTLQLLRGWARDQAPLRDLVARPAWLLDGWAPLLALWHEASLPERPGACLEIAMRAPIIPREVEAWCGARHAWEAPLIARRRLRAPGDWRCGRMPHPSERAEAALAVAA